MTAAERWRRLKALTLVVVTVGTLVVSSPVQASIGNPILGPLDAANPSSNAYAGCVASTMVGNGFVYRTLSALQTALASVWAAVPNPIAGACRTAVNLRQPQVCMVPSSASPCTGVGAAANTAWTSYVGAFDAWDLYSDGQGCCGGFAQARISPSDPSGTAQGSVTGTFRLPGYVCTSYLSCPAPNPGLYSDCGPFSCGPVTWFSVGLTGRTPDIPGYTNGEPAWGGYVRAVDGFGHVIYDSGGVYGNWYWGSGCGGPEPHECGLTWSFRWNCLDASGNSGANCANQSLAVTFTPFSGYRDGNGDPPSPATLAQQVQITLATDDFSWHPHADICGYPAYYNFGAPNDCLRWNDPRLTYMGKDGAVGQLRDNRATAPAAVIDLASSDLACLVGVDVSDPTPTACVDVTGGSGNILQAPVAESARPLIYIPGIGGSELSAVNASPAGGRTFVDSHGNQKNETYTAGEAVWLNGSKLDPLPQILNDQEFLDLLRFGPDGGPLIGDFAPSGNLVTTTVQPPPPLQPATVSPYGNVIPALQAAGYTLGDNLFIFTYDWRYNADHSRGDLDALVNRVLASTGASEVDVIAHSMGTMVLRDYLLYGQSRSKVHSAVMLAPPNLGTVKGTVAVHQGVCLPDDLQGLSQIGNCYIGERTLRYIYRTLPGGLDQTPSKAYYSVFNGADAAHPVPFRDETVTPAASDWNALANYEKAAGPTDYGCVANSILCSDEAPVTAAAFNAAASFHDGEDDWYARVSTPVAIMAGTGLCTFGEILKQPVFTVPGTGWKVGSHWDMRYVDGDGTVPRRSASLDDGRLAPNVTVYYRNFDHNGMGQKASVLGDALSILRGSPPPAGSPGSGQGVNCHQIELQSPMEMQISDAQGHRLGGLDGQTDNREIPGATFTRLDDLKSATIGGGGAFRVDLQGTATGEATIKIRELGVDQTLKVYAFNHVPVTPQTKGSLTLDTTRSTISSLTVDPDGTGQHITTYSPLVVTSNADDDTAPVLTIDAPRPGQAVVGNFATGWTATKASGLPVTQSYGYFDAGSPTAQKVPAPGTYNLPPGSHTLDVFAEDALENAATAHLSLTTDAYEWKPPMRAEGVVVHGDRVLPVKFTISNEVGAFVVDASCRITVADQAGKAQGTAPCKVDGSTGFYHTDINLGALAPGSYQVVVSFGSPTLTGSFSTSLQVS